MIGGTSRDEGQGLQDVGLQAFPFRRARGPPRDAGRGAGGSPLGGAGRGAQQHQGQEGEGPRVPGGHRTPPLGQTPLMGSPPGSVGVQTPPAGMRRGTGGCRAQAEHPSEPGPVLSGVLGTQRGGGPSSTPLPFCRGRRDSALRELPCAGQRWTTGSATPPLPPLSGQQVRHLREGVGALPRGCGEGPPRPGPPPSSADNREQLRASSSVMPRPARLHQGWVLPRHWGLSGVSPHLVTPRASRMVRRT